MAGAFFSDILGSITERGRSLLRLTAWPQDSVGRVGSLLNLCRALLSGRGEASGVAIAAEIIDRYHGLDSNARLAFFTALADDFGVDRHRLDHAFAAWRAEPDDATALAIHFASEPHRHELFRRINLAPGGTGALVDMRSDLLALLPDHAALNRVNKDFSTLLRSWFNRGFLVLRRIDWSTPAAILEKIIRYEAVHEIHDWDDLRRRLAPQDRHCYAFFHPTLIDEPLIFVEVALTDGIPGAIAPLLAEDRAPIAQDRANTAVFYSISNCQKGLAGISFGNFLIKQVVQELQREFPRIETFVTLSPVPGFFAWLASPEAASISPNISTILTGLNDPNWIVDTPAAEKLRRSIEPLAAYYFLKARTSDGRVMNSVARFHLGNGARLERINWMGDLSRKGLHESAGIMVNYLYNLDEIERNHEAFANQDEVVVSGAVKRLLKDFLRGR